MGRPDYNFDYYLRSATTSLLALVLTLATCYLWTTKGDVPEALLVITTSVASFYFGAHGTLNGRAQGRRIEREEIAARQAGYEVVTKAALDLTKPGE